MTDTTQNGEFRVHYILELIFGDNLGLNTILEFSESFSANYYCRFCKVSKSETLELCFKNGEIMRIIYNYSEDMNTNNLISTRIYGVYFK